MSDKDKAGELDDIWCQLSNAGRFVLIGGALAAPLVRKDFRGSFNALTAILATSAASKGVKASWREKRPNGEDANSFPSQHAAECFAAAVSIDRQFGKAIGPAAIGLATAVSMARVFGRKHHPVDVVAGAGIGITAGSLAAMERAP